MTPLFGVGVTGQLLHGNLAQVGLVFVVDCDEPEPRMGVVDLAAADRFLGTNSLDQRIDVSGVPHVNLGSAMHRSQIRTGRFVFFEDDVEIRATESHRRHRSTAHWSLGITNPRTGSSVHIERGIGPDSGIRGIDVDRSRQHLVIQPESKLHEARGTGRTLCVADLRLHAADAGITGLVAGIAQQTTERFDLRAVSDRGPGGMRFEQFY